MKLNLSALKKNFSDNKTSASPVIETTEIKEENISQDVTEDITVAPKLIQESTVTGLNDSDVGEIPSQTAILGESQISPLDTQTLLVPSEEIIAETKDEEIKETPEGNDGTIIENPITEKEGASETSLEAVVINTPLLETKISEVSVESETDSHPLDQIEAKTSHQSISLPHISMSSLQKSYDENELSGKIKKDESSVEQAVVKEKAPELFGNYKPSFEGRAKKFFERLKIMRLKPKTRLGLVIGIIVCTILFIGYLFLFHSEKHSITHYKEVLIEFFSKKKEIPRVPIPAIENEASIGSKPNTTEEIDTNTSTGEIEGVKEISDTKKGLDTLRKEKIKNYFKQ